MSTADNPDWTSAFSGNVNFTALESVLVDSQLETIAPGLNAIPLGVPLGVLSAAVYVYPQTSGGTGVWNRLGVSGLVAGVAGSVEYIWAYVPGTSTVQMFPAYIDLTSTNTGFVYIYNFGPSFTANVSVVGYGAPAAQVRPKRQWAAEYDWIGWECSNCNVFNPSVTISRPNFQFPIEKSMVLLGLDVCSSGAIGGTTACKFWETLSAGGFWRQVDGPPFAIGGDAANPTGPTEAGFGAPSADANVNFGPPLGHKNTLFAQILKQSDQFNGSPAGAQDRVMLDDLFIPLTVGDGLWFHAGGQTDSGSTTAILDFEMQITIKYALL